MKKTTRLSPFLLRHATFEYETLTNNAVKALDENDKNDLIEWILEGTEPDKEEKFVILKIYSGHQFPFTEILLWYDI